MTKVVTMQEDLFGRNVCGCPRCNCGGEGSASAIDEAGKEVEVFSFGWEDEPILKKGDKVSIKFDREGWRVDWEKTQEQK